MQNQTKETGLKDYFAATKQAYKEKDLPLWASIPLEIGLSPSTYIPLGAPLRALGIGSKVAKGVQGAAKVTATMKFDDAVKAADRVIMDKPLDDLATDSIDKGNLGILSTIQEYAKGKGVNIYQRLFWASYDVVRKRRANHNQSWRLHGYPKELVYGGKEEFLAKYGNPWGEKAPAKKRRRRTRKAVMLSFADASAQIHESKQKRRRTLSFG